MDESFSGEHVMSLCGSLSKFKGYNIYIYTQSLYIYIYIYQYFGVPALRHLPGKTQGHVLVRPCVNNWARTGCYGLALKAEPFQQVFWPRLTSSPYNFFHKFPLQLLHASQTIAV